MFWTDIARFLQYFRKLFNSFINIVAIFQHFNGIFSKYSLNITVLCGRFTRKMMKKVRKNNRASFERIFFSTNHFQPRWLLKPRCKKYPVKIPKQKKCIFECIRKIFTFVGGWSVESNMTSIVGFPCYH